MTTLRSLADLATQAGLQGVDPFYRSLAITGVTSDSRAVRAGNLFAAIPGEKADGRAFIAQAVTRGAAAVLAPAGTKWPLGIPQRPLITDAEPRRALARLATIFAGAQPLRIVAVTGTNGKTSTVDFLRQLWEIAGHRAASLGTLGLISPGHPGGGGLTTPDPVAMANTLSGLARDGVNHVALEASSHGLDQFRLDGLRLAAAGFSNFTRDHLDYHGSLEKYRNAKLRLFSALVPPHAPVVINADMDRDTFDAVCQISRRRRLNMHTVGEGGDTIRLLSTLPTPHGQVLQTEHEGTIRTIETFLPGRYQADNMLMAAGLAQATGMADALEHLGRLRGVRGRMELAATLPNGAAVYVDYAHTPDALQRVLAALRPHAGKNRIICVFGAGGDRDPGKRPLMGHEVRQHADLAIVTDDNPRSETPAAIRAEILSACPDAIEIGDRAKAIEAGLAELGPGDVLVVAGKGHEQGQIVGTETLPFDDAATIRHLAGAA